MKNAGKTTTTPITKEQLLAAQQQVVFQIDNKPRIIVNANIFCITYSG